MRLVANFVARMRASMSIARQERFVYYQSMNVEEHADPAVSKIAAAIGEPARARMLYCLLDARARTSTELAMVADISPSTASVHLQRMKAHHLVKVFAQGKHRYYSLGGADVAAALEALSVLAGQRLDTIVPTTPNPLRAARTCYDHIAGTLGVLLHDRMIVLRWLLPNSTGDNAYDLTRHGANAFAALGLEVATIRRLRRRFAYACVDWSERRPHLGGAVGAALLNVALDRRWVSREFHSRALTITKVGRREMVTRFGLPV